MAKFAAFTGLAHGSAQNNWYALRKKLTADMADKGKTKGGPATPANNRETIAGRTGRGGRKTAGAATAAKKRGRADDDDGDSPSPKKAKRASGKKIKAAEEEKSDVDEEEKEVKTEPRSEDAVA